MNKFYLMGTVCACILSFAVPVSAANMAIDSMNITGGSVVWNLPGGLPEEDIFSSFGPDTNLVGGYIGNGGSIAPPFGPSDPDNILFFTFFDGLNDVVTYTAASNLGTAFEPAGVVPGGPVPTGSLDDTLNRIEMDLSSWFGNINNATDVWAGTGLDDGFTSPLATGSWNPVTHEYVLTWNSRVPDPTPFPGLESTWTLTGYAYPLTTLIIAIDIKPGDQPNSLNPTSKGVIPVAILTSEDFDALQVDPDTVRFGPAEAERRHMQAHVEDVDYDGDMDLIFHFRTKETGIACGDTEVTLIGETFDGRSFAEMDSIRTVGCELTFTPVEFTPVEWTIARDTHGAGIHTIFMIADVSPLAVDDLQDIGGELIWEETQITLCADPTYPPDLLGKFISIREVGDGFLRIGDGFQTNGQGPGCDINTTMQNAFDDFGMPKNACLSVRSGDINYEFCAPLNVIQ